MSNNLERLERDIITHKYHYWVRNDPQIPDAEFDQLVEQLRAIDPENNLLATVGLGSYLHRIQDVVQKYPAPKNEGEKIVHKQPMLSLDKCYSEADLLKWFRKASSDVVVSPKVDGMALSLRYESGLLTLGCTRGDGTTGEIITDNVKMMVGLPLNLKKDLDIEVRGEAYIPKSVFDSKFKEEFSNPRNLVAGALRHKTVEKTARYQIHFMAYDVIGMKVESEQHKFEILQGLGFESVPIVLAGKDKLQETYDYLLFSRDSLDYELDGVVYKFNSIEDQKKMGLTRHHPRYAIAYKFQGEYKRSVLRDIEWSISRTGALNPVGIIDPVELDGAVVTRVSLHNVSCVKKLGIGGQIYRDSEILMVRRGGVIPHLERVLDHGSDPILIPETCPDCGAETHIDGEFLTANHTEDCRSPQIASLEHFAKVIKMEGFGEKMVAALFDKGLVRTPLDLYKLSKDDFLGLERVGDRLATKLYNNIQGSREMAVNVFLTSLGLPDLGKNVSQILMGLSDSIEGILGLTESQLEMVDGIGQKTASSVVQGLASRQELIRNMTQELNLSWPSQEEEYTGELGTFLFTGAMASMTRKEAEVLVKAHGGKVSKSVNKNLNYLVLGDKDMPRYESGWRSSKLKKAEALKEFVQVLSESDFLSLLSK